MIPLDIYIQRVGDPTNIFPGINDLETLQRTITELTIEKVVIQEAGTTSGRTSIMFVLRHPNGSLSYAQTTANLLDGLNGAVRGAEQGWQANENPFL
jgi:hypothetical protein